MLELSGTYAPRTYCTQYAETDYAFLRRILAREGIFFQFRHDTTQMEEVVALMDDALYKQLSSVDPRQALDPSLKMTVGRFAEANMLEIGLKRQVVPFASRISTFDPRNPRLPLRETKLAAAPPGIMADLGSEQFARTFHGHEAEHEVNESAAGRDVHAARTLDAERTRQSVVTGSCRYAQFTPGYAFTLDGYQAEALNRDWVLTSVRHEGFTPEFMSETTEVYRNHFEATTADTALRMPATQRQRLAQPTQTATVVGAAEGELFADTSGRIKVQFHWDLQGTNDDKSSCFIRVSQPWAGPGFGWQFLPRVGTEVVVAFLDGDPDRPLIVGSVYNGTNPTPFGLPDANTKSGIRTLSVPGGAGANELSFEDKAGSEQISIIAHRDFKTQIGNDHAMEITGDSSYRIDGQLMQHVGGTQTTTVVGGQTNLVTLHQTNQVLGDAIDAIKGNADKRVSGDDTLRVEGTLRHDIAKSDVSIQGDSVLRIKGHLAAVIGAENAHRSAALHVQGEAATYSTGVTEIISEKDIVLRCGASSIRIGPASILIQSPLLNIEGAATLLGSGATTVDAKEKFHVKSKTVNLTGESSSLNLDKEAELGGDHVHLRKHLENAHVLIDPKLLTTIRLQDEDGSPAARRRYVLVEKGGERSGILDDEGMAKLELNGAARVYFPDVDNARKA